MACQNCEYFKTSKTSAPCKFCLNKVDDVNASDMFERREDNSECND